MNSNDETIANDGARLAGELRAGDFVSRYVIRRRLGAGGMGVVYEAHDPLLDRRVALKLLRVDVLAATEEMRLRLLREAQALARLSHPHVVAVYDVGRVDEQIFIAMELVVGGTADSWRHVAPRSWRDVLDLYLRAGAGLAAAHDVGLVHRDFKPANVLVGDGDRVCVTDFGLVRLAERPLAGPERAVDPSAPVSDLTEQGAVMGSPGYMAPEQIVGGEVGAAGDVFSFCVSLYEALYGERPFRGDTLGQLALAIQRGQVVPASGHAVPERLRALVLRGLAAAPKARPPLRVLLDELAEARSLEELARAEKMLAEAGALTMTGGGEGGFTKVAARILHELVQDTVRRPRPAAPRHEPVALPDADADEVGPDAPHLADVEIAGAHAQALFDKLGTRALAGHFMLREGLGILRPDGSTGFDTDSWYPALPFVRAAHNLIASLGPRATFHVGLFTRERDERPQPPVRVALRAIDRIYHRSFRLGGRVLVDDDGTPLPGLGRYRCSELGPTEEQVSASGPWPCAFDRALVSGVAMRSDPQAMIEHGPDAPCRDRGARRCEYLVRWGAPPGTRERWLRPAEDMASFIVDPMRRYLQAETFIFWYADPHLNGTQFRGRPTVEELRILIGLWDALKNDQVRAGSLVDLRQVVEITPPVYSLAVALFTAKREEYAKRLRLALVRPPAMAGAIITGLLEMTGVDAPFQFFDDDAAALAWLGRSDPLLLAELAALRGDQSKRPLPRDTE